MATIGYNAAGKLYFNHPLSGTVNDTDIACANTPASQWSNLVYKLSIEPGGYINCCNKSILVCIHRLQIRMQPKINLGKYMHLKVKHGIKYY